MTLSEEETECLRGCSTYRQYFVMRRRFEAGECGFCNIDTDINETLFENTDWLVWETDLKTNVLVT